MIPKSFLKKIVLLTACMLTLSTAVAADDEVRPAPLENQPRDSTQIGPHTDLQAIPNSKMLWSQTNIEIDSSAGATVDVPKTCFSNTTPVLSCALSGTVYDDCNISIIDLQPTLGTGSAGYTVSLTGYAAGTSGTCEGTRNILASCFIYCDPSATTPPAPTP